MKRQKVIMVQKDFYDELVEAIQDEIDTSEDVFEVTQIDYFNMSATNSASCTAFILFSRRS